MVESWYFWAVEIVENRYVFGTFGQLEFFDLPFVQLKMTGPKHNLLPSIILDNQLTTGTKPHRTVCHRTSIISVHSVWRSDVWLQSWYFWVVEIVKNRYVFGTFGQLEFFDLPFVQSKTTGPKHNLLPSIILDTQLTTGTKPHRTNCHCTSINPVQSVLQSDAWLQS